MPRLFASMMRFSIWSRHAQAVPAADRVGFFHQLHRIREALAVQRHRLALGELHADSLGLHLHLVAPEGDAHDRLDDRHALVEELEVLRLVRGAEQVRVGGVGLLGAHLVLEAGLGHVRRHLAAAAQLVDEALVEPRLVDPQRRVGEQAVAVEALDVVALVGAAVAPDADAVLAHRHHQHGAGDRAAERRGVEVGGAAGGDVEGAALDGGDAFGDQLRPAVDQARLFGAVGERLARDLGVVRLVGLAEVGGIGVGDRALGAHPVHRGAGVEAAREGDADLLSLRQRAENRRQVRSPKAA